MGAFEDTFEEFWWVAIIIAAIIMGFVGFFISGKNPLIGLIFAIAAASSVMIFIGNDKIQEERAVSSRFAQQQIVEVTKKTKSLIWDDTVVPDNNNPDSQAGCQVMTFPPKDFPTGPITDYDSLSTNRKVKKADQSASLTKTCLNEIQKALQVSARKCLVESGCSGFDGKTYKVGEVEMYYQTCPGIDQCEDSVTGLVSLNFTPSSDFATPNTTNQSQCLTVLPKNAEEDNHDVTLSQCSFENWADQLFRIKRYTNAGSARSPSLTNAEDGEFVEFEMTVNAGHIEEEGLCLGLFSVDKNDVVTDNKDVKGKLTAVLTKCQNGIGTIWRLVPRNKDAFLVTRPGIGGAPETKITEDGAQRILFSLDLTPTKTYSDFSKTKDIDLETGKGLFLGMIIL